MIEGLSNHRFVVKPRELFVDLLAAAVIFSISVTIFATTDCQTIVQQLAAVIVATNWTAAGVKKSESAAAMDKLSVEILSKIKYVKM